MKGPPPIENITQFCFANCTFQLLFLWPEFQQYYLNNGNNGEFRNKKDLIELFRGMEKHRGKTQAMVQPCTKNKFLKEISGCDDKGNVPQTDMSEFLCSYITDGTGTSEALRSLIRCGELGTFPLATVLVALPSVRCTECNHHTIVQNAEPVNPLAIDDYAPEVEVTSGMLVAAWLEHSAEMEEKHIPRWPIALGPGVCCVIKDDGTRRVRVDKEIIRDANRAVAAVVEEKSYECEEKNLVLHPRKILRCSQSLMFRVNREKWSSRDKRVLGHTVKNTRRIIPSFEIIVTEDNIDEKKCYQCTYQLQAAIAHRGVDNSGHYIGYFNDNNNWYHFDDKAPVDKKKIVRRMENFAKVRTDDKFHEGLYFLRYKLVGRVEMKTRRSDFETMVEYINLRCSAGDDRSYWKHVENGNNNNNNNKFQNSKNNQIPLRQNNNNNNDVLTNFNGGYNNNSSIRQNRTTNNNNNNISSGEFIDVDAIEDGGVGQDFVKLDDEDLIIQYLVKNYSNNNQTNSGDSSVKIIGESHVEILEDSPVKTSEESSDKISENSSAETSEDSSHVCSFGTLVQMKSVIEMRKFFNRLEPTSSSSHLFQQGTKEELMNTCWLSSALMFLMTNRKIMDEVRRIVCASTIPQAPLSHLIYRIRKELDTNKKNIFPSCFTPRGGNLIYELFGGKYQEYYNPPMIKILKWLRKEFTQQQLVIEEIGEQLHVALRATVGRYTERRNNRTAKTPEMVVFYPTSEYRRGVSLEEISERTKSAVKEVQSLLSEKLKCRQKSFLLNCKHAQASHFICCCEDENRWYLHDDLTSEWYCVEGGDVVQEVEKKEGTLCQIIVIAVLYEIFEVEPDDNNEYQNESHNDSNNNSDDNTVHPGVDDDGTKKRSDGAGGDEEEQQQNNNKLNAEEQQQLEMMDSATNNNDNNNHGPDEYEWDEACGENHEEARAEDDEIPDD